jgi:hypothetical protein
MQMSKETKTKKIAQPGQEDWMTKKWRPAMAIMYMTACLFDFVFFPIMFTIVQFWEISAANDAFRQWAPITLQGGGLFHVAMGAVLGVSAWSRGQEKMAGVSGGSAPGWGSTPVASNSWGSAPGAQTAAYTPAPGWGSTPVANNSWGSTPVASNSWGSAPVQTGWGGKKAPPEVEFPLIS